MRTASICPTCATFENALCVLYNGVYLTNAKISPLDSLETALVKINANLVPLTGIVAPAFNATYLGQQYLNTVTKQLYYAKSVGAGASDWTLSVNGTAGQIGFYSTAYNLIGDNGLFWDNTAKRLGIGTTTPAYALDVAGNGRFTSSVIGTYFQNTGQNAFYLTNAGNNDFTLTSSGVFRILNNSQTTSLFSVTNAGLATAASLYVTGTFRDSTNSVGTAGQVLSSTVTGTDWISLPATPTLQQVLDAGNTATQNIILTGAITTSGDGSFNEVRVGKGAAQINSNTVVGQYSLTSNTTGYQNTVLGFTAMLANTVGYQNTAVGAYSLTANLGGHENVAVGDYALTANSSGYDNVAIGARSALSSTTGYRNIVIGKNAMLSSISASQSVAIGYEALINGASDSVAIGFKAGYDGSAGIVAIGFESLSINTGNSNTGVGYRSLYSNGTGTLNTGLGYYALRGNTTGVRNTAVGGQALYANTDGNYNIAVGYDAGRYITVDGGAANTGSTSSIYIGYKTLAATATDTNAIVIGNGALSLGSNTTVIGNASTTKTVLKGSVYVGATSTFTSGNSKLEVTGYIASSALINPNGFSYTFTDGFGQLNQSNVYWIDSQRTLINNAGVSATVSSALEIVAGSTECNLSLVSDNNGYHLLDGFQGPGNNTIYIEENGDIYNANTGYYGFSDRRLKENIIPATSKLDDLMKVNIVNYNLIKDDKKVKQIGVIAQELEEVFPSLVGDSKDGIKSVKHSVFVPMLIKGMQEQQEIIKNLQAQIDELKSKIQ